jgi:hypothetical protein
LLAWRDPATRARVVRRVWQRDALYRGPYVGLAPDLVLDLETPGGYSYVGLPSYAQDGPPLETLDAAMLSGGKLAGMSGSHRSDGLFVLVGEQVAPGRVDGAQIADMAPSIMALCGMTVPEQWDGRPVPCVAGGPRADVTRDASPAAEVTYTAAEEADLQQRLQRLGYLA